MKNAVAHPIIKITRINMNHLISLKIRKMILTSGEMESIILMKYKSLKTMIIAIKDSSTLKFSVLTLPSINYPTLIEPLRMM